MREEQTSGVQGDQVANVSDLKSLAINVAKLNQYLSNRRQVDQSYAVIASVQVGRRSKESEASFLRRRGL